jgi:bud site selection protein 31
VRRLPPADRSSPFALRFVMPKVKSSRKIKFPPGWDVVEDTLAQIQEQMREGTSINRRTLTRHQRQTRMQRPPSLHISRRRHETHIRHPATHSLVLSSSVYSHVYDVWCLRLPAAENADQAGKRKDELLWPIFRLHHQRSRYIYEMFYQHKKITKEVYQFALQEKYADANLIAKWKKSGYEKLCCLRCIQPKDTNYGTTCICRVPSGHMEEGKVVECVHCGCRGCASGSG